MSVSVQKKIGVLFGKLPRRAPSDGESSDDSSSGPTMGSFAGENERVYSSPAVLESIQFGKHAESNRIEFYSKDLPFFWLNNASPHPIVVDGIRYPTAEHLFQAQKFIDHRPDIANKIRKTSNPVDAVHIARMYAKEVRSDWIKGGVNVATMRMVLLTKFMQYSDLRLALLETGDAEIVHASPNDAFWGSAACANTVGRGRNVLGRTIMQTRELLRVAAGVSANSGTRTV